MKTSRSVRRYGLIAAGVVLLYTVVGFLILPPIARTQLEQRASAALGRRVTVERVRLNPYALSVTVENLAIQEQDVATRFLGWRRLYVNFDALSSLRGAWVLSDVELDGFAARGVVNRDRSLNVSDVLARLAPPDAKQAPATKPSRPVRVGRLVVTQAKVDFMDNSRSQPFATTAGPLSFELTDFVTAGERDAPYRFEAVTEAGERLAWSGTLRAQPFQSVGELRIENLMLPKYAPYYADFLRGDLTSGRLTVKGRYELDLAGKEPVLRLAQGAVQLRQFALREHGAQEPALDLPTVDVTEIQADATALKAAVAGVTVNGGHVRVRREKDGSLNLLALLQPPRAPKSGEPTPAGPKTAAGSVPAALPDVKLGEFAVKDFDVEVEDLAAPRPTQLGLKSVQLTLKDVTLAEGARMPVQLAFGWAPQGNVRLTGTVGLSPIMAELQAEVASLSLLPLSAYLEDFANVRLSQGAVSANLTTKAAMLPGKPPEATVAGDVSVEKFGLVDGAHAEDLVGFARLRLVGLRAGTTPELSVTLDEVNLAGPYARAIMGADQTLNVVSVAKPRNLSAVAAVPAVATASAPVGNEVAGSRPATGLPKIEVRKVVISEGSFQFIDRSLKPGVNVGVREFGGTIAGLSAMNPGRGDVDLHGLVEGAGPVSITGKLDPLGAKMAVDLKIDVKNVDLVPLSPYTGKYAGYELARGKLLVDVKLLVDGRKIDAANVVTLNQFTFGGPVESADATKLPVRLAVALLKDLDGNIVIDIPVRGSLDDPEFKVGRVVLRVIGNLLTKAAVSPFALLGAAFGGGGDELAYQEFAPGAAELQAAETKKLDTMVKALANRPGLSLDLDGSYDLAADAYALKRAKLADRVRRAVWQVRHDQDPNIPPPADLVITPEEYAAMVKKLFDAAFPPGTQFGTPLPSAPAVVAPPAASPGLFRRMIAVVTFANQRAQRKAAEENARVSAEHQKAVAAAIAAGRPLDEMEGRLAEAITVEDSDLQALAQARAERVRAYFVSVGKIAPERLFLAKAGTSTKGKGPRVFLNLQ